MQQAIKPAAAVLNENYKKQLAANEYQLILNPHEELANKIQLLRNSFSETYEMPVPRRGKPNLSLVRFTQLALMEERIVSRLKTIAMSYPPFKVELKDFSSLPTHSIFINVTSKLPIRALVKEIRDVQRLMKLDKEHKPHFIDEPNVLIARNLLPWQYEKAWLEYSHKHFTGRFIADGMLLLRRRIYYDGPSDDPRSRVRSDNNWQIAERFAFMNLPVTTRQGELFR